MPEYNREIQIDAGSLITLLGLLGGIVALLLGYHIEITYSTLAGKASIVIGIVMISFCGLKIVLEGAFNLLDSWIARRQPKVKKRSDLKVPPLRDQKF